LKKEELFDLFGQVDDKYVSELYDDLIEQTDDSIPLQKKHSGWKNIVAIAAVFCFVILATINIINYKSSPNVTEADVDEGALVQETYDGSASVIIDVNPSLKFILADDGTVDSIIPLNKDAEIMLADQVYESNDLQYCINELIKDYTDNSYISPNQNSILVSVTNYSDDVAQFVCDSFVYDIESAASSYGVSLSILSQIIPDASIYEDVADEHQISVGKAALIETVSGGTSEVYGSASELSIQSLNQIAQYTSNSQITRIGEVAGAVSEQQLESLGVSLMSIVDAFSYAENISQIYSEICSENPQLSDPLYYQYSLIMQETDLSDGSQLWSLITKSALDPAADISSYTTGKSYADENLSQERNIGSAIVEFIENLLGL